MVSQVYIEKKLQRIKTFGHSMYPLLHNGDIVYLKKTAFSRLKVNDIICFKKYGILQTHRIIYRADKYLITKGDNNFKADGKIYERQVIGRVYQVKRDDEIFDPEDIYLVQSTLYFQEIVKIKKAFEKAGIDFVFLKGLPLHLYYEGTHPRRLYADCDMLVDNKQYKTLDKILISLGYKQIPVKEKVSNNNLPYQISEVTYYQKTQKYPVILDIHFEAAFLTIRTGKFHLLYKQELVNRLTKEFLDAKRTIIIYHEPFPILSTPHLIIFLALHFFHHNLKGVQRLSLLNVIINKYKLYKSPLLAKKLVEIITIYELYNFVTPSFLCLEKYYKAKLPTRFITSLKKTKEEDILLSSMQSVFDEDNPLKSSSERFTKLFLLSPTPLYKKIFIFINPDILRSLLRNARHYSLTSSMRLLISFLNLP